MDYSVRRHHGGGSCFQAEKQSALTYFSMHLLRKIPFLLCNGWHTRDPHSKEHVNWNALQWHSLSIIIQPLVLFGMLYMYYKACTFYKDAKSERGWIYRAGHPRLFLLEHETSIPGVIR